MIVILDFGVGNLGSIASMLRKLDVPAVTTGDPEAVARADRLILPGVGAFDNAMSRLEAGGSSHRAWAAAFDTRREVTH